MFYGTIGSICKRRSCSVRALLVGELFSVCRARR